MSGFASIPQTDPKASYLAHHIEIDAALRSVIESGSYILGPEVEAFEADFAAYVGVKHAIGVASGTDALELALRGCGVGLDHAVFTVSHTAVATVAAIERCGAEPVLVDIDPATYTLDPIALNDAVHRFRRGRPAAVVPVHLYGFPADMPAILDIARQQELWVIEDCAQSHGARLHGRPTGSWGDAAAFSFYPTKNLGAMGDGGAVTTRNEEIAERVRELRQYGWRRRYVSAVPGFNSRLDELQAAVLRVKLRYLEEDNQRRKVVAERFRRLLAGIKIGLPEERHGIEHVYHQFVIRAPERDALQDSLKRNGIGTLVHYRQPVHRQPAYAKRLMHRDLPHSEQAAVSVLSLPMYPQLREEQVFQVARMVRAFYAESGSANL